MWCNRPIYWKYEMHDAARRGDVDAIPYLLGKGHTVDEWNLNGSSPLGIAASCQHTEMVRALLDYGADPDVEDGEDYLPLDYAVYADCIASVLALINHGDDPHKKESRALHALHKAAEKARPGVVEMLLEQGMPVDSFDESHPGTPLHQAAGGRYLWEDTRERRIQVVQLLLARGADVGTRREGLTPLALAARYQRMEVVALLRAAGARMEITDAAVIGDTETVRALLDRGADIESRDPYDQATPLLLAADYGHAETVDLLLSRGADVQAANENGYTALELALNDGKRDAALLLMEKGGAVPDQFALFRAIESEYPDIVRLLIQQGTPIDTRIHYEDHDMPLHQAAARNQPEIVALLLAAGAEVDAANDYGFTPLMLAAEAGVLENVRLLLAARADVHRYNLFRGSPLGYATIKEHAEIVALLRAHGAQE